MNMDIPELIDMLFPTPGYYVEAGAHDGVGDSQTYRLEKRGWGGICVEPSRAYQGLVRSRRCKTDSRCLGPHDGQEVYFREVSGNAIELSGLLPYFDDHWDRDVRPHHDRLVTTVSLTTLLASHQAPAVIQLLVLDTEGSELAILRAHDYSRYLFQGILVEHNGVITRKVALEEYLEGKGYHLRHETEIDYFFLHESYLGGDRGR